MQGLQNRAQNGLKIGSTSHLRRGDPQNASREALGAFLEASGAEKKKLGAALARFSPKKGAKMDPKMGPRKPLGAHRSRKKEVGNGSWPVWA